MCWFFWGAIFRKNFTPHKRRFWTAEPSFGNVFLTHVSNCRKWNADFRRTFFHKDADMPRCLSNSQHDDHVVMSLMCQSNSHDGVVSLVCAYVLRPKQFMLPKRRFCDSDQHARTNEDCWNRNKRSDVSPLAWSTFQGCAYSIWAKWSWNVSKKDR